MARSLDGGFAVRPLNDTTYQQKPYTELGTNRTGLVEIWNARPSNSSNTNWEWYKNGSYSGSATSLSITSGDVTTLSCIPVVNGTCFMMTAVIVSNTSAGNSYYVQHKGTYQPGSRSLDIVKGSTSGSVALSLFGVAQANWNVDRLDGSGRSGRTLNNRPRTDADPFGVMFVTVLSSDALQCGFVVDGTLIVAHEWSSARGTIPANTVAGGFTEVKASATGTGTLTLSRVCLMADTVPAFTPNWCVSYCGSTSAKVMTVPVPGSTYHILASLQQTPAGGDPDNRRRVIFRRVRIVNLGGAPIHCRVVRSGTSTGLTYDTFVYPSTLQYSSTVAAGTAATYNTFSSVGVYNVVANIFVPANGTVSEEVNIVLPLPSSIMQITIDGVALSGASPCSVWASLDWNEFSS